MAFSKKIVCIGGGSGYFAHVVPDLLITPELAGSEIVLYDLDLDRAELVAAACGRLAAEAGSGCTVRATGALADAVDGADFALSSIGGSGAQAGGVLGSYYHSSDIYIAAKYGIHQVVGDTCGPGGMMMGMRAVPAYIEICREMEQRCPGVILFNHSNPMAVLCRAMRKYTGITVVGMCHGVQGGLTYAGEILEVPPEELECVWIGTNHYYWFLRVLHKGRDVYPELRERMARRTPDPGRVMSAVLSGIYGYHLVYPNDDHIIEFYPFSTQVKSLEELPYGMAEEAAKHGIVELTEAPVRKTATPEQQAEAQASFQERLDKANLPAHQDSRFTGEGTGLMLAAIASGKREVCVANIANQGAVTNLPLTAEVELECVTDSRGVRPIQIGEAPLVLKGILEKRFVWQELVADAAVRGDRNLALQALLMDEAAIWPEQAEKMLDELLAASRDLLPQFKW